MSFWLTVFGRGFNSRRLHHLVIQQSLIKYKSPLKMRGFFFGKMGTVDFILRLLFRPLVRRLWISEVHGLDNIPRADPYVIALNHESHFNFICIIAAVNRRIHC